MQHSHIQQGMFEITLSSIYLAKYNIAIMIFNDYHGNVYYKDKKMIGHIQLIAVMTGRVYNFAMIH